MTDQTDAHHKLLSHAIRGVRMTPAEAAALAWLAGQDRTYVIELARLLDRARRSVPVIAAINAQTAAAPQRPEDVVDILAQHA